MRACVEKRSVLGWNKSLWPQLLGQPIQQGTGLNIKLGDSLDVTIQTKGTKIYFKTLSLSEVELKDCPKLQLTSHKEWNPAIVSLGELKSDTGDHLSMMRISEMKVSPNTNNYEYLDSTDDASLLH